MMDGRRPTIASVHGVVAAAHPLAAQAGARLLGSGGNAFDAAAATAAALSVVEPFMSGLAGMGLATCWIAREQRVRALDFVTRIPERFPLDRLTKREQLARGPLAVGPPGNLAGWCELVKSYGRKPLAEVLGPAIALARDGFPLLEFGAVESALMLEEVKPFADIHPLLVATYTGGAGRVSKGMLLRQPDLALTYAAIAKDGPAHLYNGPLARAIVAHLEKLGGCLTLDDIASVQPVWKEPISTDYRGLKVHVPPPPCEGFQFLLTLKVLEGFDLAAMARNGAEHLDTVFRAIRLCAGERIANNNPQPETLARLFSADNIARLRARIRDPRPVVGATEQWVAPDPGAKEGHTTSFSIADREGNLVCVTNSLGSGYGSGVVVPGTGVCLNNFLYWAEVTPGSPNRARPRGLLNMCVSPSISLRDGRPVLALGTPGSYGILQTQTQAMVQYVDFARPLQDAIEAPRGRLWDGSRVELETRVSAGTVTALKARGHDVFGEAAWTWKCGGMHAVALDPATGVMTGACDPRRDGYVATA